MARSSARMVQSLTCNILPYEITKYENHVTTGTVKSVD